MAPRSVLLPVLLLALAGAAAAAEQGQPSPAAAAIAEARNMQEIQAGFERGRAGLTRIFLRHMKRMPREQVLNMELGFTIEPDGRVSEASVQATNFGDPELDAEIVAHLRKLRFPPRAVPAYSVARYPVRFVPPP